MFQKRKICVVITARPSYSRIRSALFAVKHHPELELQLVVAGSALLHRYGNVVATIEKDGFNVDARVFMVLEGQDPITMAKTTGLGLLELASVFYNLKPDAVVTIADRFETLSTSVAAAYQNIPLVHLQGGEVTGNIDEKVRHANTKLADLHLVCSEEARQRVIRLGEKPELVINTGCPSLDLVRSVKDKTDLGFNPLKKYGGVGADIKWKEGYIVVLQHSVTTDYYNAEAQILETLFAVKSTGFPTCWFWPNVDAGSDRISKGIRAFRERENPSNIRFFKNMEPLDFLLLLKHARVLIGNSSAGLREAAFLGLPVVNIGNRQQGRCRAENVKDVPYDRISIERAIKEAVANGPYTGKSLYGNGNAGAKIAHALATCKLDYKKTITY